jgi:hypothetical protein
MGADRIRHLLKKALASGDTAFYWNPSKTLSALGMSPEAVGTDEPKARARAAELNGLGDELRRGNKAGGNSPRPDCFSRLFKEYRASDEFAELKPRTRADYIYYGDKIDTQFGHLAVRAFTPKVVKTYYRRIRKERSVTWAYHILGTFRAILTWAVSEDWIDDNPALKVVMKSPKKRKVIWELEQAVRYVAKAMEMGWHSVAVMTLVLDSIAQSPIDGRTMKRGAYDGLRIAIARAKTGVSDAPIPLFPEAKAALDVYLKSRGPMHPDAPMFASEKTGDMWDENALQKVHRKIRTAAGLPDNLQLQDFRRTAQTEAGAGGGTVDEIRALARHTTREAGEHYVIPDASYVENVQNKRLVERNRKRAKVRMTDV